MLALSGASLISIVAAVFGLAIMMGGAIAVLFGYLKKTTKDILREENSDLRIRLSSVEESEKDCKARLGKAEATIKTLTDVFSGQTAVLELKQTVDDNHNKLLQILEKMGSQ